MGLVYIVGREFFKVGKDFLRELNENREKRKKEYQLDITCNVYISRNDGRKLLVYSRKED